MDTMVCSLRWRAWVTAANVPCGLDEWKGEMETEVCSHWRACEEKQATGLSHSGEGRSGVTNRESQRKVKQRCHKKRKLHFGHLNSKPSGVSS